MRNNLSPILEIHLTGTSRLVADAIEFRHNLLGSAPRRLTRGRSSSAVRGTCPLPWSAAVRAFVRLAITVALQRFNERGPADDPFAFGLIGEKGSLCRSLDYAISKKPDWIMDLFGYDSEGDSYVGRFFWRDNPEGKREGPTKVTLNTKMIAPEMISVRLHGDTIVDRERLVAVLAALMTTDNESSPSGAEVNIPVTKRTPARSQSDTFVADYPGIRGSSS